MKKRNTKGNVMWTIPNRKKVIGYTTKATSDLIVLLAETNETIEDCYNAINYDKDGKEILKKYIDLGYGNIIARKWFRWGKYIYERYIIKSYRLHWNTN